MNVMERKLFFLIAAVVTAGVNACDRPLASGTGADAGAGTGGNVVVAGTAGTSGSAGTTGAAGTGFAGSTGTAGSGGGPVVCQSPAAGEIPPEHRAAAVACSPSKAPPPDGGVLSCATSADCSPNGALAPYSFCLHGQCSFDACLTDADCGSNEVCGCSSDYYGGNAAYRPNVCVPGNCHVDSDCGVGGYCSPSRGYCGSFQGFYCHGPADSCVDPAKDCQSCQKNACLYSPAVGAFICGSATCAG